MDCNYVYRGGFERFMSDYASLNGLVNWTNSNKTGERNQELIAMEQGSQPAMRRLAN